MHRESVGLEGMKGCPTRLLHDFPVPVVPLPGFGVLFEPENAGSFAGSRRFVSRCSACCPFVNTVVRQVANLLGVRQ
jgi:hypothetical protein